VPEGKQADAGAMSMNWMKASGSGGIPTAFVVDKTGHIAWIGHPMAMEEPLDKIVAGKWDLAAFQKQKAEEDALGAARHELNKQLAKFLRVKDAKDKDFKGAIAAIDEAIAKTPKLEEDFGFTKFRLLLETKDYDAGYAY